MSGLVELLLAHREDPTWPDSCVCQDAIPAGGFRDGQYADHLANAIAAHLAEVVGWLRDDVAIKLDTREECEHERDVDSWGYECPTCAADAVLAVVAEALTGHPARSGGAVGATGGEVAAGEADDGARKEDRHG